MAERSPATPSSRSVVDTSPVQRHHQLAQHSTRLPAVSTPVPAPFSSPSSNPAAGSASVSAATTSPAAPAASPPHLVPAAPSSSASPSRITRSSARRAASQAGPSTSPTAPATADPSSTTNQESPRKRKAAAPNPSPPTNSAQQNPRRSKRQRVSDPAPLPRPPTQNSATLTRRKKETAPPAMSSPESAGVPAPVPGTAPSASSSRMSSRSKKQLQPTHDGAAGASSSSRRSKRTNNASSADQDTAMSGTEAHEKDMIPPPPPPPEEHDEDDSEGDDEDEHHPYDDDDEDEDDGDDPFGGFGGPGDVSGLSHTLRALTGMMSGMTSRLREILNNLRRKDNPSMQLIALQELSEILLVSNEDNLSGHFSPDAYVKELVTLMQPNEVTREENPEIMLLACRSLANLMEALPASVANVVYGGAVPILCQKLLEISFIDLAEQALSTLEKISFEYPTSIVREGGLTACLSYLEFFATSTQRTAVTTAANCCRNIPEDSFPVVRDVMPILLNVLGSSDQRVVEQASLCVSRIVESFKYQPSRLEELVSVDLLKAVLRLLLPGTTNLIGPNIHTQFLRVLAHTARASPRLSAELFKMNVVETLYQILTGVSPPSGTEDVASKLDSMLIMQALIHRPRDQIIETLNVVCELLPSVPRPVDVAAGEPADTSPVEPITPSSLGPRRKSSNEKRVELLETCKDEVRRFALILFPTLTDAFSSTVNLSVRQKVLTAQLKMLSNLDESILADALKTVPYASFLAAILSQQDHPSLVMSALQATQLLLGRLDSVYRYQLYREGVITEITKLATEEHPEEEKNTGGQSEEPGSRESSADSGMRSPREEESGGEDDEAEDEDDGSQHSSEDGHDEDENENDPEIENHADDMSGSPSSDGSTMSLDGPTRPFVANTSSLRSHISEAAKRFLETYETEKQGKAMKKKALGILDDLSTLASDIRKYYLHRTTGNLGPGTAKEMFKKLASYFDADVLESVTSAEMLSSGMAQALEEVFSNPDEDLAAQAQAVFLEVFMGHSVKSKPKTATADSPATPFSVMVHKLQDLLSRSEHFEVTTVHHNAFDGNRSSAASMLAKSLRVKLVAEEDSGIPRAYRNIMVSVQAIATFKSLDDYLRPKIALAERPRIISRRDGLSRALAVMAGSAGLPLSAATTGRFGDRQTERPPFPMTSSSPAPPPPPSLPSSSRATRKSRSKALAQGDAPSTPHQSLASREKAGLRRSSRRHPASGDEAAARPPPDEENNLENALECADEKQISDDEDGEELGDPSALEAIVGDLDEEMEDAGTPQDPSAVNLEVAAGGRITARKEDGTRVPTPSQVSSGLAGRASALTAALQSTPTPAAASRPMSYAAAIQAIPQDWHLEFSLDGRVIPSETTVYRAVHSQTPPSDEHVSRSLWSAVHPIKMKRVPGPPTTESIAFGSSFDAGNEGTSPGGIPESLSKHPTTASILRLLKILHDLNANIDDILVEDKETLKLNVEPLSQFVNTKLTAKLNRQLEEPLIVASNCLPSWSEDLASQYPFLFPFETRHLFLQSTSFGYARSMNRWQNASQEESRRDRRDDRSFLGRLQRQKVRISRSKILESAIKVMELYGASQSILEVEYFEEVGTGLGPTLEFYSTVSKEFAKKKLKLWRDSDSGDPEDFVMSQNGLFPRPVSNEEAATSNGERILQLFKMLGKFVARSMIDSRIIDINFNPIFFRIGGQGTSGVKPSLGAINVVDPILARSLMIIKKFAIAKKEIEQDPKRSAAQKVADTEKIVIGNIRLDDLYLDFTLPGHPEIELIPNGSQIRLSIENVELYLEKVIDLTLGHGVNRQVEAFRQGFSQVFPYSALSAFTPDELVTLFGQVDEDWSLETLMDSIKADHGFNMDSKTVKNLLHVMSELTPAQRRDFLQFTTGSPKLPIGGFKSLTPMFTVVCKPSEAPYTSDDYLPSVMTCVNYLKLPDYSTLETMRKQLFTAIVEGQGAFHLS